MCAPSGGSGDSSLGGAGTGGSGARGRSRTCQRYTDSLANSLGERLSICEVRAGATGLDTGGDVGDESLVVTETMVVPRAATAKVGMFHTAVGAARNTLTGGEERRCSGKGTNKGNEGQCQAHCELVGSSDEK